MEDQEGNVLWEIVYIMYLGMTYMPLFMISNIHGQVPLSTVKCWSSDSREYRNKDQIVLSIPATHGAVDAGDVLARVYQVVTKGKKWDWPHYMNTFDALNKAAFRFFEGVDLDEKWTFYNLQRELKRSN